MSRTTSHERHDITLIVHKKYNNVMNLKNIFFFEIQVATSFPRILYCVDFGTGTQKWNREKQIFFAYDPELQKLHKFTKIIMTVDMRILFSPLIFRYFFYFLFRFLLVFFFVKSIPSHRANHWYLESR